MGVCCEWVSVVDAGRGISVWSEYLVTRKYNNEKRKIQLVLEVHYSEINVLGEASNVNFVMKE